MPNDTQSVHLHVSSGSRSGFTSTTASDGSTYYYKYTGGPQDVGNWTFKTGGGTEDVEVTLHDSNASYQITDVTLTDPEGQLSKSIASDGKSATITDIATKDETATYCVVVKDGSKANCTFNCDPTITNEPN